MCLAKFARRAFLFVGLLMTSAGNLGAQTDFNVKIWQAEDGLPNNIVQAIAQARDGYIWVGTREGLARFDGENFQLIKLLPQTSQPSVTCLFGSRDGSIWVGTDHSGIFHLQGDKLTHCDVPGGGRNISVYEIQASGDGVIWFGTSRGIMHWANGGLEQEARFKNMQQRFCPDNHGDMWILDNGLRRLNSNTAKSYPIKSGSIPNVVRSLYCDQNGIFWIGAGFGKGNGLIRLKNGVATRFKRDTGPAGIVSVVFRDSMGDIWVGSYAGLSRFKNGKFMNFRAPDEPSYRIYAIIEDREHDLWVGSEEGLARLTRKRFKTITKRDGLSLNTVVSICPCHDGGVWISSWGGGINHYLNGKITHLRSADGLKTDYIMAMTETSDSNLWLGADYGGPLQRINNGHITAYGPAQGFDVAPGNATVVLHESPNGVLWIGTRDGLQTWNGTNFSRFTTKDGLCNNTINAICEGASGDVWVGTEGGLTQWQNGKFNNLAGTDPQLSACVLSLYFDAQDTLWIGTKDHGLLMMHGGVVKQLNKKDGLFSDSIYAILEDNYTNLWLNSSRGIFRVNKLQAESVAEEKQSSITSISYGKSDGILASGQFNDVTQPAGCEDLEGRLWFRTTQGAVVVDPGVIAVSHQPPPVVIQKIIADDKTITFGMTGAKIPKPVRIPPGRGELEIQYAALSYTDPDKNVYKYKLGGVNSEWVNAGNVRVAKYYNLHPGKYRFQITACNNDGIWNPKGQSVELILEPHFWQTWWFLSICIMAAVGTVSGVARFVTRYKMQKKLTQLEQQRAVERERARIARDVHDELGVRLTRISYQGGIAKLCLNDSAGIEQHIEQMSASAREAVSSLHEIIWAADPQNDSLEGLLSHIGHYAEEFFNACGIRCEVITPKLIPTHHISARVRHDLFLAVKEAMNNAAKHANASRVLILIEIRKKEFEIVVSDDGSGFDMDWTDDAAPEKASHSGYHGLSNMHERLRNIHGKCVVESRKGRGTAIRFTIPLHEEMS